MKFTYDELRTRFPKASEDFLRANSAGGAASRSVAKQVVRHDALAATQGARRDAQRIAVRITSYRRRIIDPDNLTPKYFVDGLRYAALIPDDREQDISLEVRQVKVKNKEAECTIIELT